MEIVLNISTAAWDQWLADKPALFLQSAAWAAILRAEGKNIELLEVREGGRVVAQAMVVYTALPFGWRYAFCPGGPVIAEYDAAVIEALLDYFAKKKCIFWRVEPERAMVGAVHAKKVYDITPRATTLVDLAKDEEALLAAMHTKTRYNIRLAEKKGVIVAEGLNWDAFWRLTQETGKRDGFRLHGRAHYEAMFASPLIRQLTASVDGVVVATAVFAGFGSTFTYVFGASDHAARSVMAPQLVQWEGIRLGKRLGYTGYDFFGIAPPAGGREHKYGEYIYDEQHQYAGVTRFKLGFGGRVMVRPGTFDLLISTGKYTMYGVLRRLRRLF